MITTLGVISLGALTTEAAISPIQIDLGDVENSTSYGGTQANTDHSGYTGTGFLAFNNSVGSGFTVAAPYEFTSVTLRYAANSANAGEFYVYIDESSSLEFSGSTIVFAKTGAWTTWTEVTLDLAGDMGDYFSLAFVNDATNNGGSNFDYIEFTPVPETASYSLLLGLATLTAVCTRRSQYIR